MIPLINIASVGEGSLILTIYWRSNPEEDRDNQHNENKDKKAIFSDENRDTIMKWCTKINSAVTLIKNARQIEVL